MKLTLQEQYNLIKEGKFAKDVFTKHAKSLFPDLIPNNFGFDGAAKMLTQRGVISENIWGVATEAASQPDWFRIFEEYTVSSEEKETKADATKPSKEVDEYKEKSNHDAYQAETGDDVIFDQYLRGIQIETCKEENAEKSVSDLKKIVLKNLKKDNLYYTKNAAFNIEGIGYTDEAPGLGKTKEVKGKYASSGMEPVKINEGIGMFNEPIGFEKPELNDIDKMFTKKYKGDGIYAIYKNGKGVKIIKGEGNANAWINDQKRNMKEANMNIKESQLRSAIRQLIKEELNLKEIDTVGEEASKEAKIRKINEEISKRKKKLKALETLKELEEDSINPKKIKELYSEVKKLEAAKNKLEKKGKKKETLVDEITVVDKNTTSDEMNDIAKQEKTTPAAVKQAVNTAKTTGEPVNVA
jgi:hypothetical protein